MTRYEIVVEPRGSLFVGGYAEALGASDGDTAADAAGLLLPGSAVKGALREAAARLVAGIGRREARAVLERLFGGVSEEDRPAEPGVIRIGPLRPESADRGDREAATDPAPIGGTELDRHLSVRHHVSLERASRQAAPRRLFENRVTAAGLVFRGELQAARALDAEERGLLEAAASIADQLGAGRGRGLGMVAIRLTETAEEGSSTDVEAIFPLPVEATRITLVLEAEEPLHLAAVKDYGNYTATKTHLDGSSVRGAVAAVLVPTLAVEEMDRLFGGESPVVFGDGHPGSAAAIPAPRTLREPKAGGEPSDDAIGLCAETGGKPYRRPPDTRYAGEASYRHTDDGWRKVPLRHRTVTRAARDHASGRGAEGQLYSLEVLDPWLAVGGERLRFHLPVKGSPEQLARVVEAAAAGLVVGGDRSRGFGSLRLVEISAAATLTPLGERHHRWSELVGKRGVAAPESTGALLALGVMALSQTELKGRLANRGLELIDGVARRGSHGGWNGAARLPRTVPRVFLPGSVFIVRTKNKSSALEALAALEREGLGPGRPDGWGRLVACHPIHVDCWREEV